MNPLAESNFHNNFIILGEYFINLDSKDKEEYTKALNEIYFYANSLRLENREAKRVLSEWRDEYYKRIKNDNNGNTIHIS
tara:strand:- start:26782 stop:27021 length:240 start_codon:yes stop_codon:yes gene_type:complete